MSKPPPAQDVPQKFGISISWKLLAATIVTGMAMATIAILGLQKIQALNTRLTHTIEYVAEKVKLASLLQQDLVTVTRAERNMILARGGDEMQRYADVIDDGIETMNQRLEKLRPLVDDDDQHQLDLFADGWDKWRENHEAVRSFAQLNSDVKARALSVGKADRTLAELETALAAIADKNQREFDAAKEQEDAETVVRAAEKRLLVEQLLHDAMELQRDEKNLLLAPTEEDMNRYEASFEPLKRRADLRWTQLTQWADSNEAPRVAEAKKAWDQYIDMNGQIRAIAGEKGNYLAYQFAYVYGAPLANQCESLLASVIDRNEQEMTENRQESLQTYVTARNALFAVSAIGIIVSVAISFFIGQRIARNLGVLARHVQSIQDTGDLSQPTPPVSRDEVGKLAAAFDHMRQSLYAQTSQLAELNHELESKTEEMQQFVYTVSHDLKSPLVSCKGLLGLLKEDLDEDRPDDVRDSVERLEKATDQLDQTIDDLLTLSRIGRKSLHWAEVDVRKLALDLCEELSERIEESAAEVTIDNGMPTIAADPADIRRALENLLSNALKYACDGPRPVIHVGCEPRHKEVRFFVRDNGPGVAPEYQQRIFGLFQRLDTKKPGTGLGLASVTKIMRMHGGRAWVESVPGQGATFWLAFPRRPMFHGVS